VRNILLALHFSGALSGDFARSFTEKAFAGGLAGGFTNGQSLQFNFFLNFC